MAVLTQTQQAAQMLAQLKRLDPSVSAEVGTPERKILDTVAQALADNQIDLTALQQGLNIDSKFGDNLDRFLTLFGFKRQAATFATGFVTFSRPSPALIDTFIPSGTTVQAVVSSDSTIVETSAQFLTTSAVTLPAGETEIAAPIRARIAGVNGNVAAGQITQIISTSVIGVTTVTNETATRNGADSEDDDAYKIRFKNTVFRNLAGTRDQYLALAVATQYSVKANVVGPQSLWREYMQVPLVADNAASDVDDTGGAEAGNGLAGEYTTALSILPYAKSIWTDLPVFVSNNASGLDLYFFREDVDFRFNNTPIAKDRGDAHRLWLAYGGIGGASDPLNSPNKPNVSFINVYTGANADISAIRPNDVVLVEFYYLSDASRNNLDLNITNAVDVYVDGGNEQFATTVLTAPVAGNAFVDDQSSKYHYDNYRRSGEPQKRPLKGNYLMPLFWEPVTSVPSQIIVGDNTYLLGTHYWMVEDISELGGTIRARSGIEWSAQIKGTSNTTARLITEWTGGNFQPIEIEGYGYDRNIVDLQASLDGSKQITTDVLAHKATTRYFKLDITIMYSNGANVTETNNAIQEAVDTYFRSQYFGAVIQLSDILGVIHEVGGVDNVRWSSDLPNNEDLARVYETDINGALLLNVDSEIIVPGSASAPAIQRIFVTGKPNSSATSVMDFTWNNNTASPSIPLDSSTAINLQTYLRAISGMAAVTVTEESLGTSGNHLPIRTFTVTWPSNGAQNLIQPISKLQGGPTVIYNDFALRDNELPALPTGIQTVGANAPAAGVTTALPADTVSGLIIRVKAQQTWIRS